MPHRVAVLALQGVVSFDLATACEVFGLARERASGRPLYEVVVCGEGGEVDSGHFRVRLKHGLSALSRAQTLLVPGTRDPNAPLSPAVRRALRRAHVGGTRIASLCSGAFVLAQMGLLDGLRATTHWLAAAELARTFPAVDVDPRVLYVDNGQVLTSAGAAAGLDLCLHMVRQDFGAAVAAQVARLSVLPLQRDGGQAQFIEPRQGPVAPASLQPVLAWALAHLHRPLSLKELAAQACSSERTLHRRFLDQFGVSPKQWLQSARMRRAQELLESGVLPIGRVADEVGMGSPANFRAQFQRLVGVSPSEYRRNFGGGRVP